MKMNNWLIGAIMFFLLFTVTAAMAAAVNPIGGIGARGRAMTNGIAAANDASIFYYNPSLLAFAPNFASAGLDYVGATFEYETPTGQKIRSARGEYFVPIVGVNCRPNHKIAWGLGIITPFAFGADFKDNLNMFSKLSLTNITPAIAYKINDSLSIGAAAKIGYGKINLTMPITVSTIPPLLTNINHKADGWGYGWQIGFIWKPAKIISLGGTYQSKIKTSLNGDRTVPGIANSQFSTEFSFPGYYGLGVSIELGKATIAADWMRFDYSSTDNAHITYHDGGKRSLPLRWENNHFYGAGAEYKATDRLKLRAGLAYQNAVIPDSTISPATPDMDGWAASGGIGYRFGAWNLDTTYLHAWGPEKTISSSSFGLPGKYSADIDIISFGVTYNW